GQRAERHLVITLLRGVPSLRLVEGRVVDGGGAGRVAAAHYREVYEFAALANREVVGRELHERSGLRGGRVELAEEAVLFFGGRDGVNAVDGEGPVAHAVGAELADEAQPDPVRAVRSGHGGVELRIGDVDRGGSAGAEGLDVEGVIVGRDGRIDEAAGDGRRR